ncbi:hypothetical protein LXL04_038081 [Taraxacum kok-saghyz]
MNSQAIDGADGFQNTHQPKRHESAKFSIDQVAFILEKVRIIWEPLLLPFTYKQSMSTVLEAVSSSITKDILMLDDIAAEETLQLQRLIHMLLENLSSLTESLIAIKQTSKQQKDTSPVSVNDLIPSLPRLQILAGIYVGHAFEVDYCIMGKWGAGQMWLHFIRDEGFYQSDIYGFATTERMLVEN